jgi:hypothetical protein
MRKILTIFIIAIQLSCRTTGSKSNSELQAWQAADVKENAKKAFITAVQTCVPLMADFIQQGRGEQIRKMLNRPEVEKFVTLMLDYGKKESDIDPALEEFYKNDQQPFDCDPTKGFMPNNTMAEYIVLEFINKSGLLKLGFAAKGSLLSSPPEP